MIYVDIFEKAYQFLQDEGIAARRHIELKQYTTCLLYTSPSPRDTR